MRTAIQSGLNVSTNSSLFPPGTIDDYADRAYIKFAGLFNWPDLEDAKKSITQADIEYYDVPDTWRYDSTFRLTVDGDLYGEKPEGSPMDFNDYLKWKSDNLTSTLKKWAKYRNQIFIYPTPSSAGLEIVAWGRRNPTLMSGSDSATTIFSSNMPEINEAIVLETMAMLQRKGEKKGDGQFDSVEAKQIAVVAFSKVKQDQAKFEKAQPQFNVPDYMSDTKTEDTIGNFADYT